MLEPKPSATYPAMVEKLWKEMKFWPPWPQPRYHRNHSAVGIATTNARRNRSRVSPMSTVAATTNGIPTWEKKRPIASSAQAIRSPRRSSRSSASRAAIPQDTEPKKLI